MTKPKGGKTFSTRALLDPAVAIRQRLLAGGVKSLQDYGYLQGRRGQHHHGHDLPELLPDPAGGGPRCKGPQTAVIDGLIAECKAPIEDEDQLVNGVKMGEP